MRPSLALPVLFSRPLFGFSGLSDGAAFDQASWTKTRCTVVADAAVDPNGRSTADKIVETAVTNTHIIGQAYTFDARVYRAKVFAKAAERSWLVLVANTNNQCYFDVGNGVLGSANQATGQIIQRPNGWFECIIDFTAAAETSSVSIYLATANNTSNYAGDVNSGLYLWGASIV